MHVQYIVFVVLFFSFRAGEPIWGRTGDGGHATACRCRPAGLEKLFCM